MRFRLLILIICVFLSQCKEAFTPAIIDRHTGYLVVEGFIEIDGLTEIRLTRTRGLKSEEVIYEEGAILTVETESGRAFALQPQGEGRYRASSLAIGTDNVRLRIITADNATYLSSFVEPKATPPIDRIGWEQRDDGVHIFVNTHDDLNQSHYYFWKYEETWHFRSLHASYYEYIGNYEVRIRENDIHNCWSHQKSTGVYLANTTGLNEDRVEGHRILAIPNLSEKLGVKYSILVKQYTLTAEAYQYWEILQKNTEEVGSIFDPQPSNLSGNIQNINDPEEPVIGFISVSKLQEARIYIDHDELQDWNIHVDTHEDCIETQAWRSEYDLYFRLRDYTPLFHIRNNRGDIVGYTATFNHCADCTLRGSNIKPDFWPE